MRTRKKSGENTKQQHCNYQNKQEEERESTIVFIYQNRQQDEQIS